MNTLDLFKSFSEPIRLRLLHLLGNTEPELCVCDLVAVLDAPQGTISRHLTHLRLVGLVTDRREGVWVYYRLAEAKNKAHAALLECLTTCFEDDPELANDLKQYHRLKKSKSLACCAQQNLQGRPSPSRSPIAPKAKTKL
jgi:ArsR family transcriptional regulator